MAVPLSIRLLKPEYLFRPSQIWTKWRRSNRPCPSTPQEVMLPWKLPLRIYPNETIGRQIWLMGVFDLIVSETLWRLASPGDHCLDVGANIGYMTSVLAAKVGPSGKVQSFEPHPQIFIELEENVGRWQPFPHRASIDLHPIALGESHGTVLLEIPEYFSENRGVCRIKHPSSQTAKSQPEGHSIEIPVPILTLDSMISKSDFISVMKMDVEGAELSVLKGGRKVLEEKRIENIVFEESATTDSPTCKILRELGYEIFNLGLNLMGLMVSPSDQPSKSLRPWDSPSLLATLTSKTTLAKLQSKGWKCLQNRVG